MMLSFAGNKYKLWVGRETLAPTTYDPVTIVFIISIHINDYNITITGIIYSGLITVDYTNNIM